LPARTPLGRLQQPNRARTVELRRLALERYLQALLRDSRVHLCGPLLAFLSSVPAPTTNGEGRDLEAEDEAEGNDGWMARIHRTVTMDIEGIPGAASMLELIVQELGAQVALQQPHLSQQQPHPSQQQPHLPQQQPHPSQQPHLPQPQPHQPHAAFVDPLSDLFMQVFGLTNRRNWLRRQAISILLRHIFGGTVERRIRDILGQATEDKRLAELLDNVRRSLWADLPKRNNGFGFAAFAAPPAGKRPNDMRRETAARARARVLAYVPGVLGSMVGRRNAREGARTLIDAVQDRGRNLGLVLHVFDLLVATMFPEIKYQMD
ncbi:tRNA (guanine-N(7)-)-methyltransferase (tRNA(m7G46)-methyltransferase), partial [Kickxella alabastrina]